jgi:small redox-active disulfide protein 2
MKIQILGSGCTACKNLYNSVEKIVQTNKIDAEIEYIMDIERIVELGVMSSPVLVIDDEIIFVGVIPKDKELEKIIVNKK